MFLYNDVVMLLDGNEPLQASFDTDYR